MVIYNSSTADWYSSKELVLVIEELWKLSIAVVNNSPDLSDWVELVKVLLFVSFELECVALKQI